MKTEVVLKYDVNKNIDGKISFNENRSCIEICISPLTVGKKDGLMKTEVVLKFVCAIWVCATSQV